MKSGESTDEYMKRLRASGTLPHNGQVYATTINRVNLNNVRNYVVSQAGDANRTDYNLANTCATQAVKAINAGLAVTNYAEAVAR